MIKANFNAYGSYVTDSVTQWDINQILTVTGLNLVSAPEVHFSNASMRAAIVRQAEMIDHIVTVKIPNSLLQSPLTIKAEIGVYEGATFKTVELVEIPVRAAKKPEDYSITDDEEIYSFNRLENELVNKATNARVDNIIAHNNDTDGNTELLDIRTDVNGNIHNSAGSAIRDQLNSILSQLKSESDIAKTNSFNVNKWSLGEINTVTGKDFESDSRVSTDFIYLPKGADLYFNSALVNFPGVYIFIYDTDKIYIRTNYEYVRYFTATENCFVRLVCKYNDGQKITDTSVFNDLVTVYYTQAKEKLNTWVLGGLNVNTGETDSENFSKRASSRFIFLYPGEKVIFNSDLDTFPGFYVFVYDENRTFVNTSGGYVTDFIATENCYIRLLTKYNDNREITDVTVFNDLVTIDRCVKEPFSKNHIIGNFDTYFMSPEYETMTDTLRVTTIDDIYGRYDELMSAYPENITKNLLGYATASLTGTDTSLPIYEYVISADISDRAINDVPTILIQSGIHGNEKSSVYSTLLFFEELFGSDDGLLMDIRSCFNFKVIPILNPYGYNANSRNNARNIDINRNFEYNWDIDTSENKGSGPYSEYESQILRDWLKVNKTALMYIDYHNTGDYNPFISYINTPNETIQNVYSNVIRRCTTKWRKKYHNERKGSVYGWLNNDKIPCTYNEAIYNADIPLSCILEIAWDENEVIYTKRVIETGLELLVNFIAGMIDFIKK